MGIKDSIQSLTDSVTELVDDFKEYVNGQTGSKENIDITIRKYSKKLNSSYPSKSK